MPRGGRRQGQPGVAYSNRVDLLQNRDNAGSAAGGGFTPAAQPATPQMAAYPEDSPGLLDPTSRPNEPVTDGLAMGAGRGPSAIPNTDPRLSETVALKKWLPLLEPMANDPATPDSVRTLIRYIRGA